MSQGGDFLQREGLRPALKRVLRERVLTPVQRRVTGPLLMRRNRRHAVRRLEIGPGPQRIAGFETLNITGGRQVDYIADATRGLPFADGSFDIIYASHVLEHVAWFRSVAVLRLWRDKLKPGGRLEVWVPDALKIAEAFVDAERRGSQAHAQDGWWRFNDGHDPCLWFSGRVFSYGDGSGTPGHFNWHLAAFSERRLIEAMREAGLRDVARLPASEVRGYDHGWINLGVCGLR
jgi:SAM-dependent methyltransferase